MWDYLIVSRRPGPPPVTLTILREAVGIADLGTRPLSSLTTDRRGFGTPRRADRCRLFPPLAMDIPTGRGVFGLGRCSSNHSGESCSGLCRVAFALAAMIEVMGAQVVNLLSRPVYGLGQIDRLLGLQSGTARRWIDGYHRGGKTYPPVIREHATGDDIATWGEFVETRLLAEYRDRGVPLIRMRPAIEVLREELGTPYPLASARTWLDVSGRELVRRVQDQVGLEAALELVVVRTKQHILDWSEPAEEFRQSLEWTGSGTNAQPRLLRPMPGNADVVVDPLRGFGEPVVRSIRTEVIAELLRAGDSPEMVAELYDLKRQEVDAAVRYELSRVAA
jgi:uncharacterized protein (DUF433 family)